MERFWKAGKRASAWVMVLLMVISLVNVPGTQVEAASKKSVQSVKLNYTEYTLKKGKKLKLKATILPKNAKSKTITWKSSKKSVATVSSKGVVKAVKKGTTTITATVKGTKKKAKCKITVGTPVKKVTLNQKNITMIEGESATLKATVTPKTASNKKLKWTSSDSTVVSVTNGKLVALKEGKAVITAQAKDGSKKKTTVTVEVQKGEVAVTKVRVNLDKTAIKVGETAKATATVEPADASVKTVTWSTSDAKVAKVDNTGKITGLKAGKATITATSNNKITGSVEIEVKPIAVECVSLDKQNHTMKINESIQLTATVEPNNAADKSVTWKSSDESVVIVDDKGKVSAIGKGDAVVTVKTMDGNKEASCAITVDNVIVTSSFKEMQESLEKDYEGVELHTDEKGEFTISGDYSDTSLAVDAPNATITNEATFKDVEIQAISPNTWIERAIGNYLNLFAEQTHLIVEGEDVRIFVGEGANKANIENNGTIGDIKIATKIELFITGENKTTIPVESDAEGTVIKTSIPLSIDAEKAFVLNVKPGAETTVVVFANDEEMPTIYGIGVIKITNKSTNEVTDVVADNIVDLDETSEIRTGAVTGIVKDYNDAVVQDAAVYVIPCDSAIEENAIDVAIQSAKDQERCYETTTNEMGKYKLSSVPYGNYLMVVKANDLQNYLLTVVLNQETVTNETITMVAQSEEVGTITGTLYNAFDAKAVSEGISLILRKNHNNTSGISVATTKTSAEGKYEFDNILPGNYTIQVVDNRTELPEGENAYIRMSFNVTVIAGETTTEDMTISQGVTKEQIRFVLTWGKEKNGVPSDLDSHLIGPDQDSKFHTYYSDETFSKDDRTYADLDVDDTDYEGPETTTVYQAEDGIYHFYVYDFSNQENKDNLDLATSEAIVKVYRGEQNVATYNIPSGTGTLWDVCTYDINKNILTPINKITYHPGNSEDVGMDPLDIAKKKLKTVLDRYSGLNFGTVLSATISEKLANAKQCYASETDATAVIKMAEELSTYFEGLLSSTKINEITSERIKRYAIYQQGVYDEYDESNRTGYSTIEIQMKDVQTEPEDLSFELASESASYVLQQSDMEGYSKMLVVTNSDTQAVEKYYISYKRFVPSLYPQDVKDGDNYIVTYYTDYNYYTEGDNEKEEEYLIIKGENATLNSPTFTFGDEEIEYTYVDSAESEKGYIGTLTVTYDSEQKVFPVKYIQTMRNLYINNISSASNYITNWYEDWYDSNETEYKVYEVYGLKEEMGTDLSIEFEDSGEDLNYTIVKEEGFAWNYKAVVSVNGMTQDLYIKYTQTEAKNLAPYSGSYKENDMEQYFNSIQLDEDVKTLKIKGCYSKEISWNTVRFMDRGDLTYSVRIENETPYLDVYFGETLLDTYLLSYQLELSTNSILVNDPDNDWMSWTTSSSGIDEADTITYCMIYGENETLGDDVTFSYAVDEVDVKYEVLTDSALGIGKVTFTYEEQSLEVYVRYEKQIHSLYINDITDSSNYIASHNWDYVYDEDNDVEYSVCCVYGLNEELNTETTKITFDVADVEYTLQKEDGAAWNYKVAVTYKGETQYKYLKYIQDTSISVVPTTGKYTTEYGYFSYFSSVKTIEVDGTEYIQVSATDNTEFDAWDTVVFDSKGGVTYSVRLDDNMPLLDVYLNEALYKTYPLVYVIDLKCYYIEVTSDENYIVHQGNAFAFDESGEYVEFFEICGENDTMGNATFSYNVEGVEVSYKEIADPEYVGEVTLSYGESTKTYLVRYEKKMRNLRMISIDDMFVGYSNVIYLDDGYHYVESISGSKETLDGTETYNFGSDVEGVVVKNVTPVEGEDSYNYVLEAEYKGETQNVYIQYTYVATEN